MISVLRLQNKSKHLDPDMEFSCVAVNALKACANGGLLT